MVEEALKYGECVERGDTNVGGIQGINEMQRVFSQKMIILKMACN